MHMIIGPGAVGTVLTAFLRHAGEPVRLRVREEDVANLQGSSHVLVDRVRGRPPVRVAKPPITTQTDLDGIDTVFICVKHPDLPAVLDAFPGEIPEATTIVPCLNGVGAGQRIRQRFPGCRVAPLTVMFNAQLLEPLHARISTKPNVLINSDDKALLGLFGDSGLQVQRVHDEAAAWGKLLINLANGICALTDTTFYDVLADPDLRAVFVRLLDEATAVLDKSAARYRLPVGMPYPAYRSLLTRGGKGAWWLEKYRNGLTKSSYPSMVADLRAGRPTEIDELGGEIVRLGQLVGLPTPANAKVVHMVHAAEAAPKPVPMSARDLRDELA